MTGWIDRIRLSLEQKLIIIIMSISIGALLFGTCSMLLLELRQEYQSITRNIGIIAEIAGNNCITSLATRDPKSATEQLASLRHHKSIDFATVFDISGAPVASYVSPSSPLQNAEELLIKVPARDISDGTNSVSSPVMSGNEQIGTIVIRYNLDELYNHVKQYIGVLLFVSSATTALAMMAGSRLQRFVSYPILSLAETAEQVSETKDYSIRAVKQSNDETGILVDRFNELARNKQLEEELRQANLKLQELSRTDTLTGIANRRCFDETVESEWYRAIRTRQPLALAILDLDFFKQYNDCYGHQQGDECLKEVAAILSAHCRRRASDFTARYGGEEFVLILPAVPVRDALVIAESIRRDIEDHSIPHENSVFGKVTASIGVVSILPTEEDSIRHLIAKADEALYCAKNNGRNRVVAAGEAG